MVLPGFRSSMSQNVNGGQHAVVIAASHRCVEEEMAGLLESPPALSNSVDAALDVGMAGLPVIGLHAAGSRSTGSVANRPG